MSNLRRLLKKKWAILFFLLYPVFLFSQDPVSYNKSVIIQSILPGDAKGSLKWIDGFPSLLVFNYGCSMPFEQCSFIREYSLFSFGPSLEEGAWSYERQFTDSLSPLYLYIVDLDGDGLDDIATQNNWSEASDTSKLSFYFYKGSRWERFNYNAGKALGIGIAAEILPYPGEELVFTYANDPDLSRDADEWDPRVGIAVMAWDSGEPVFFFDDTQRHGVAGIGRAKDDTGHFYFVEGFLDSETWPGDRRIAHIVKYAFSPETKQFTELYRTRSWEPHLSSFQGGDREISVKDSVVSVLKGNLLFRYLDNGSGLKQLDVQQVDTLLMDSFWFDYDTDGTDEIFGSQYSLEPITPSARFSLVYYEENE
jgi:hypothetical protein